MLREESHTIGPPSIQIDKYKKAYIVATAKKIVILENCCNKLVISWNFLVYIMFGVLLYLLEQCNFVPFMDVDQIDRENFFISPLLVDSKGYCFF